MKNPAELKRSTILALAKARIDTPEKWCRHFIGTTSNGWGMSSLAKQREEPARLCALGAVYMVMGRELVYADIARVAALLDLAANRRGHPSIPVLNDASEHDEVMAAFDDAIELATKADRPVEEFQLEMCCG